MLLDTTYTDKKNKKIINDLVGKHFSILESFKLKGIGSKRMKISEVSHNLKQFLHTNPNKNYSNIELRPNGILLAINTSQQNYTWAIPYYQLYIYKTNGISIHAQGKFVHFDYDKTYKENTAFFDKLIRLKVDYDQRFPHIDSI